MKATRKNVPKKITVDRKEKKDKNKTNKKRKTDNTMRNNTSDNRNKSSCPSRILGIASTPYHLMVFLFIKDAFFEDSRVDILLTDKTASLRELYTSKRLSGCFDDAFFADGRQIRNPYKKGSALLYESLIKNPEYKRLFTDGRIPDLKHYSDIFFASPGLPDEISKEIIKEGILKNRHIRFHRFEDGFASYTKPPVSSVSTRAGRMIYKAGRRFDIKKAENRLYLFEPGLAEPAVADVKSTGFHLKKIPNSPDRIRRITRQLQKLFDFKPPAIDADYIFLGQGTDNITRNPATYSSLISEIAQKTGYEHFCMKPHPRGTYDRFDERIALYEDPAPFELAFAGGYMENKTLLSYYSTACVSGKLLFHSGCRIIFLYPLAGDAFNEKCDYELYFSKLKKLYDHVEIARSKEELWKLLESGHK